ncbi:cytochrome b562 [Arsukibacterium perlucidum]|uniref:cytochrome b562 n=1 Tax=Arsukibacterium perlucidum TaxID=368811 RepID=UPI0003629D54|nr:cytochrome b562 [Arsukibacterium perlucidum]
MFSRYVLCLLLLLPLAVSASNSVNLETTMKSMGLALKQAREAASPGAAKPFIDQLTELTEQAKVARFPEDKAQKYLEGLDKVLLTLQQARDAAIAGDNQKLQQALTEVEQLRRYYHKQRKVSFWQILFG